ncbi:MAG: preprotein translocase subunit YajC [Lachnospiraceae bacterium]|nr:preprotein translocase subunit YajC [Lachnospiraceae bacterium]
MGILLTGNALASSGTGQVVITVVYIVAIVAFLYFVMIRPQRKEQGRMKDMLSSLEVGDSVCTTSGFYGIVIDITDDTVIVEFGNNKNCRIPMKKEAIVQIEKPEETADTDKKKK